MENFNPEKIKKDFRVISLYIPSALSVLFLLITIITINKLMLEMTLFFFSFAFLNSIITSNFSLAIDDTDSEEWVVREIVSSLAFLFSSGTALWALIFGLPSSISFVVYSLAALAFIYYIWVTASSPLAFKVELPADKISKIEDSETFCRAMGFEFLPGGSYLKSEKKAIHRAIGGLKELDSEASNYDDSFARILSFLEEMNEGVVKREAFFARQEDQRKVEKNECLLKELRDKSE